jgi:hypothetical protein
MVLLLNYLPLLIIVSGIFALYKSVKMEKGPKRKRTVIASTFGTVLALMLVQGLTAGYIPKNRSSEVKIPVPSFDTPEVEIQNNLLSPKRLNEESEARFNAKTDWRQHKRDEEASYLESLKELKARREAATNE